MTEDSREDQVAVALAPHFRIGSADSTMGHPENNFIRLGIWRGDSHGPQVADSFEQQ